MLKCLDSSYSLLRFILQQLLDEVLRFRADVVPHLSIHGVATILYKLHHFKIIRGIKWWLPATHYVQDDAAAPNITFVIVILVQNFGSEVVRRALPIIEVDLQLHGQAY